MINCSNVSLKLCMECNFNDFVKLGCSSYSCFIQRHKRDLDKAFNIKDYIRSVVVDGPTILGSDIPYNNVWFKKAIELYYPEYYDWFIKLNVLL